jgi:hypothetical protein
MGAMMGARGGWACCGSSSSGKQSKQHQASRASSTHQDGEQQRRRRLHLGEDLAVADPLGPVVAVDGGGRIFSHLPDVVQLVMRNSSTDRIVWR